LARFLLQPLNDNWLRKLQPPLPLFCYWQDEIPSLLRMPVHVYGRAEGVANFETAVCVPLIPLFLLLGGHFPLGTSADPMFFLPVRTLFFFELFQLNFPAVFFPSVALQQGDSWISRPAVRTPKPPMAPQQFFPCLSSSLFQGCCARWRRLALRTTRPTPTRVFHLLRLSKAVR